MIGLLSGRVAMLVEVATVGEHEQGCTDGQEEQRQADEHVPVQGAHSLSLPRKRLPAKCRPTPIAKQTRLAAMTVSGPTWDA